MPSSSKKQHRYMEMTAHDKGAAKREGVSQPVARSAAAETNAPPKVADAEVKPKGETETTPKGGDETGTEAAPVNGAAAPAGDNAQMHAQMMADMSKRHMAEMTQTHRRHQRE